MRRCRVSQNRNLESGLDPQFPKFPFERLSVKARLPCARRRTAEGQNFEGAEEFSLAP